MPRYILTSGTSGNYCCDNSIDRTSAMFFSNLATKLIDMVQAFEAQIEKIKEANNQVSDSKGILLAAIDMPVMTIGVKYEYVEYIKRYGPPTNGNFDETLLQQLRDELGISNTASTI